MDNANHSIIVQVAKSGTNTNSNANQSAAVLELFGTVSHVNHSSTMRKNAHSKPIGMVSTVPVTLTHVPKAHNGMETIVSQSIMDSALLEIIGLGIIVNPSLHSVQEHLSGEIFKIVVSLLPINVQMAPILMALHVSHTQNVQMDKFGVSHWFSVFVLQTLIGMVRHVLNVQEECPMV